MKNRSFKSSCMITLAAVIVLFFGACSKTGPAGPQGAQGNPGTDNIIYSAWSSLTFTGSGPYSALWDVSAITQDVLDKGTVLVYFKSGTYVIPLPATFASTYIYLVFDPGHIRIGSNVDLGIYQFRYIIIPGGVASTDLSFSHAQLLNMRYEEICKHYHIAE